MKKFNVTGMSCAACSARVERAVSELSGVKSCSVNLLTGKMSVDGSVTSEEIVGAVVRAGYGATPDGDGPKNQEKVNQRLLLQKTPPISTEIGGSFILLGQGRSTRMGSLPLGVMLPFKASMA